MSRPPRDHEADRAEIVAAADRLLAGTPLRSATGKLTGSELIIESGLRHDVVYGAHKDLVQEFHAKVKAQHGVPASVEKIQAENQALKDENAALKIELAAERQKARTLSKLVVEQSLELKQAKEELSASSAVTRLLRRE